MAGRAWALLGLVAALGGCPGEPDPCAAWWGCGAYGLCETRAGVCVAGTDEACAASWLCEEHQHCRAGIDGWCEGPQGRPLWGASRADCERERDHLGGKLRPCPDEGRCHVFAGRCVALTDADCADTHGCKWGGSCAAVGGVCRATRAEDCRRSRGCQEEARCTLEGGLCVASRADCRTSPWCLRDGKGCDVVRGACDRPVAPFIYFQF